ncbi:MAG: hypothetical protein CMJ49_11430 [Planctomycetaceae bacterium]|nr:hypothetical protein [Planctomycetaceae bacterium]
MDVFIDNDPFTTSHTQLGRIINDAADKVAPARRIIVEVRLDGDALDDDQLAAAEPNDVTADEVQFITADPYELARQTLLEVQDRLDLARDAQQRASVKLQADNAAEAMDNVREAMAVWQVAQDSLLKSAQLLNIPLDDIESDGRSASQTITLLAGRLAQMGEQLNARDWIGLADTLGYELDATVDQWSAMIDTVAQHILQLKQDAG